MDLVTTLVRRINMPSLIRKIRKIFEKESSAETPRTQAKESIHANVHADYWKSIEKAMLEAERMKAKCYAMYDRQRCRLI
jgi:hypothetical protein